MGRWIITEKMQGSIREKWKKCSECRWEHALVIPSNFCPNCGADNRDHEDGWTIAEVIIYQLQKLTKAYEEWKADGSPEDYRWWEDEYGSDMTYGIDCHVVFQGDPPCLIDERNIPWESNKKEERWAKDAACAECKAIWLMGKYE